MAPAMTAYSAAALDRSEPIIWRLIGRGGAHMIAARSAPFASCGLTLTHISDAGVAPESDRRNIDAASAGRSSRCR
jgi:hypothetical protein